MALSKQPLLTSGQLGPKCEERLKAITFVVVMAFCVSPQDKRELEYRFYYFEQEARNSVGTGTNQRNAKRGYCHGR